MTIFQRGNGGEGRRQRHSPLRLGPLVFYELSAGWHHTHACLGELIGLNESY